MNLMVWLKLMTSVVLRGLFAPTVDSPPLQPSNKTSDYVETENYDVEAYDGLGIVTSALAGSFVKLVTIVDTTSDELESNATDGERSFNFTMCSFTLYFCQNTTVVI